MKKRTAQAIATAIVSLVSIPLFAGSVSATIPQIELTPLGSYESGIFDDSAAEIVAYDARFAFAYVTNAANNTIDIVSVYNPRRLRKLGSIDLSPYGAPNSVAVKNGIVAVAKKWGQNTIN